MSLKEIEILLTLLIENIMQAQICRYYQGDEESCLRNESVCTCNCNGWIGDCEFLAAHHLDDWKKK